MITPQCKHYFLHIPRTGGSTVIYDLLPRIFHPSDLCSAWNYDQLLSLPAEIRSSYRTYAGHFSLFLYRFFNRPMYYMTMLRHPVDRAISEYMYIKSNPAHPRFSRLGRRSDFLSFIRDGGAFTSNSQTLLLGTDLDPFEVIARASSRNKESFSIDGTLGEAIFGTLASPRQLNAAKANLEKFLFVGIQDQFVESSEMLLGLFGRKFEEPIARLNAAVGPRLSSSNLPCDVLDECCQREHFDLELYEFGRGLFQERYAQFKDKGSSHPFEAAQPFHCHKPARSAAHSAAARHAVRAADDSSSDVDALLNGRNPSDMRDDYFVQTYKKFSRYSRLSLARAYSLYKAIEYIARNNIPGDLVECGAYLGGAAAAAAAFANRFGLANRTFWLLDSFEAFPDAGIEVIEANGNAVKDGKYVNFRVCTEQTLSLVDAGTNRFQMVEGLVKDILPTLRCDGIALLRLDTDDYASTKLELEALYPKLSNGGVLIVDTYGEFKEVRRATDEYLRSARDPCLLHRVDRSARSGVKIGAALVPSARLRPPRRRTWSRSSA
jgi:O-methyltransferase